MILFLQCLKECWLTHGWGRIEFDPTYQNQGFLMIKTYQSPYSKKLAKPRPSCFMEAGILTSFFSRLTGRDLLAIQISCESMGSDCNRFVIALEDRLAIVDSSIEEGLDYESIMTSLLS